MSKVELAAAVLMSLSLLVGASSGASYTISVHTDLPVYTGPAFVHVSGQISPAPGPNTAVLIRIFNPNNHLVGADQANVNGTTGLYSDTFIAGGSSYWIDGGYMVNATWGAYGPTIFAMASFTWSSSATTVSTSSSTSSSTAASTTSSTSSSTSSSSSSSAASSSSTSSATSSTASSGGGGGIPEFPFQLLIASGFTILLIASYLLVRRRLPLRAGFGKS